MPDQRLSRTRISLPADYQYGDAGKLVIGDLIHIRLRGHYDVHTPEAQEMARKLREDHEAHFCR